MSRPLAIAFLACNKNPARYAEDASWLYRCDNLAWALARQGHHVVRGHWRHWPAQPVDLVVLHRPLLGWRLRWQLAAWRRAGTRVLADFDDLVFEPGLAPHSPGVLNGQVAEAEVRQRFAAHRLALAAVDGLSLSTEPLLEEARAALDALGQRRPLHWLPNAVHHRWLGWPATPLHPGSQVLSYLSGTHSHDRDFACAAPGISRYLAAHPLARLEITGRGQFALGAAQGQCEHRPRQPFLAGYVDQIRRARINLMPLEPTRFNRCKSALKVLEAGFWQVPTVCSPLPDARRFEQGAGAVPVPGPDDWADTLAWLSDDPQAHDRETRGLRERILARADVTVFAQRWLAHWREALAL